MVAHALAQCHFVSQIWAFVCGAGPSPAPGAPPGFSTILQDPKGAAGSRAQTERLPTKTK